MEIYPEYNAGTEAQILALTPESPLWKELAYFIATDKNYYYQIINNEMKPYGNGGGVGIMLNGSVIGGVKSVLSQNDSLIIPKDWEYNSHRLINNGTIANYGTITTK